MVALDSLPWPTNICPNLVDCFKLHKIAGPMVGANAFPRHLQPPVLTNLHKTTRFSLLPYNCAHQAQRIDLEPLPFSPPWVSASMRGTSTGMCKPPSMSPLLSRARANAHVHAIVVVLVVWLAASCSMPNADALPESDSPSLLKLKASLSSTGSLADWDATVPPCKGNSAMWTGLRCVNGSVTVLQLEGFSLEGTIDVDALAGIPLLHAVSFMNNNLSGPIPDFRKLSAIRGIFLANNHFSGTIPADYFDGMEWLRKVWLSGNSFSGQIPTSLASSPRLRQVRLDQNNFIGKIPDFRQPHLLMVHVANNDLEGEIPASLYTELPNIILPHGHLKSSNVLLDENYEPLLTDYGLAPVINTRHAAQLMVSYKAPECASKGHPTNKSDVWSFGVLVLEILTGKIPSSYLRQGTGTDLPGWVRSTLREEQGRVFDEEMGDIEGAGAEMMKLLQIGLASCEEELEYRWEIWEALRKIEGVKEKEGGIVGTSYGR